MAIGRIFQGARVFFQNFSRGGTKVAKFVFSRSKLRKQYFFAKMFKIQGGPRSPCPLSNAHVRGRNMVKIHNPLAALLGWDKVGSDC